MVLINRGLSVKAVSVAVSALIIVILVVAAGLGYYYYVSTQPKSKPSVTRPSITIGTAIGFSAVYYLPILVAQEKGFWAQNGLNVTWQKFTGGPALSQQLASGQVQVGMTGGSAALQAIAQGVPIKIIASYIGRTSFSIMVNASSPITSLAQLNNTNFAVSSVGGLENVYAAIVAQKFNLNFRFTATGGLPSSLALLASGKAQAIDFPQESVATLLSQGKLRVIYNVGDALPTPWTDFVVVATNSFIQSSPATLKQINSALKESLTFIVNNPEFTDGVIRDFTKGTAASAQFVRNSIVPTFTPNLTIDQQALISVATVNYNYKIAPTNLSGSITNTYTTQFMP